MILAIHLGFPEIAGDFPYEKPPFRAGEEKCEVAIIWPEWLVARVKSCLWNGE